MLAAGLEPAWWFSSGYVFLFPTYNILPGFSAYQFRHTSN